jgi:hypothetical protein
MHHQPRYVQEASVTFTATPTNGGTPSYQWQVNGTNAGTKLSNITTSRLNNGDVVTVIMTSTAACASPTTATSTPITMTASAVTPSSISKCLINIDLSQVHQ